MNQCWHQKDSRKAASSFWPQKK